MIHQHSIYESDLGLRAAAIERLLTTPEWYALRLALRDDIEHVQGLVNDVERVQGVELDRMRVTLRSLRELENGDTVRRLAAATLDRHVSLLEESARARATVENAENPERRERRMQLERVQRVEDMLGE